jgi:3-hydroxyacyl-[acyl-carrier-protein] dehydratase
MKLKNSLYTITRQDTQETGASYGLTLHAEHVIYQAHFPGQPITPGVCIIQIAKELLEDYVGQPLEVQRVKNIKFLSVISPVETPAVTYLLQKVTQDDAGYKAQVEVVAGDKALAKISFYCKL